ncbi:MAG: methionyl-tRNA formyltransferase [Acidimicrobiales bacterium]
MSRGPSTTRTTTATRTLAYLGTPAFAVPPLRALVEAGHRVQLVVTRPDRRRGRGASTSPSPVKAEAERLGLPVAHDLDALYDAGADLGVVVAYGHLVPVPVLERLPMVNLHFSLLPRWRGAAPLERAILAGDEVTGVCLMGLEAELDTGPLYAREELVIAPGEHLGPLRDRLVVAGTSLLLDVLAGALPAPEAQRGEPTYADKLGAADLRLTWTLPATELLRVVRLDRAWTTWRGRRLLVLDAEMVPAPDGAASPGTLEGAVVSAGDGALELVRVQPEGRSPMRAIDWLRGARPVTGERLGGS